MASFTVISLATRSMLASYKAASMTSLNPEIRAEVSKLRASKKQARIIDAAFDEGRLVGI
jgi:hypothetical protein